MVVAVRGGGETIGEAADLPLAGEESDGVAEGEEGGGSAAENPVFFGFLTALAEIGSTLRFEASEVSPDFFVKSVRGKNMSL